MHVYERQMEVGGVTVCMGNGVGNLHGGLCMYDSGQHWLGKGVGMCI